MARRRLLQDTEPPATEAIPFAAAVPASAVAMGAIPEDEEPPTTSPSADDVICDLQDRLDASTSTQRDMQGHLQFQQQMMDQAATNQLLAQLTAAVASSTAAAQDVTAAVLFSSQEDTAAAAENDTQPAADEHEAAQGTDVAGDELQRDAAAAAQDDSKAAHRNNRNTGQHGGNDSRHTGTKDAQGTAAATKGMQTQDSLAAAQAQEEAQAQAQDQAQEQAQAAVNTQHTGMQYAVAAQGTIAQGTAAAD